MEPNRREFIKQCAFQKFCNTVLHNEACDAHKELHRHMFKGLDRRLAEFLFAEAERTGSDTIRMTHEQIAQHISSAREAVARMLKSFSEDGLVELKRGAITLRDKNRLNRLK